MDKKKIAQYILLGLFIGFLAFLGFVDSARAAATLENWPEDCWFDSASTVNCLSAQSPYFNLGGSGGYELRTYIRRQGGGTIAQVNADEPCVDNYCPFQPFSVGVSGAEAYEIMWCLVDATYPVEPEVCGGFTLLSEDVSIAAYLDNPVDEETYLTAWPPLYIGSSLSTDVIQPIFTAWILDSDDNQLYQQSFASTGKVGGYWIYDSITPALPDGNYKISARVYSIDQDKFSDWTPEHYFTVSAPTGGGGTSWGDELEEPVYVDEDFGLIGNWFRDVLLFLFMPSTDQMGNLNLLINKLKQTVPLRYFFDIKEAWDSASKVAGEPPSLSLDTNFGAIVVFDGDGVKNLFGESNWELIKDFSRNFIILAGLVYLFFRFLKPMFKL